MDENEEIGSVIENAKHEFSKMSLWNKAGQIALIPALVLPLMNIAAGLEFVEGYFSDYLVSYRIHVSEPVRSWFADLSDVNITTFQFDALVVFMIFYWSMARAMALSGYDQAFEVDKNAFLWKLCLFLLPLLLFLWFPKVVTYVMIGYIGLQIVNLLISLLPIENRILDTRTEPDVSEEDRETELKHLILGTRMLHYTFVYLLFVVALTMILFGVHQWWSSP